MKKVVAIGGGTGLSNLLRGLKEYPLKITAIVAMTDDGASTGRLRRETGMLPPGDIRKCIAALAKNESDILDLFNFRFKKGFGISGHSMGNLFLSALTEQTGSFERAVEKASEILNIMGKVIPATLEDIHLGAEFVDGIRIMGQVKISQYGYKMRIKELFLSKDATANPRALDAIKKADIILVGPGSLFSSIFPSFLLRDFKKEFQESKAKKIYIANVSTERGETDDFKLSDHLNEVERYIGEVDLALANNKMFPQGVGDRYVEPVEVDVVDGRIKLFNLADVKNPLFHDSKNLAEKIAKIIL